jgi:hypothetical protein
MKFSKLVILVLLSLSLIYFTACGQEKNNPEKIFTFNGTEIGYASLSSTDDTLLVSYGYSYPDVDKPGGIFWFRNGKKIKSLDNTNWTRTEISPDGNYYTYVLDDTIYVNKKDNSTIAKIPTKNYLDKVVWSYDSKTLYFCELGGTNKLFSYDISTRTKQEVFDSKDQYFNLVTVKNTKVLYLLKNTTSDPIPVCDIMQYDFSKKEFKKVNLPNINNSAITYSFTISPDEKIIMFFNIGDGYIYVIDKANVKVIDKIKTPPPVTEIAQTVKYSWKSDSSYVIFTMTGKEIYKYTIPPVTSEAITLDKFLTLKYAKYYHQFPGGKELSEKEQQ